MSHNNEDIEDLQVSSSIETKASQISSTAILPKQSLNEKTEFPSVFVKVFGCSHANSDGEYIAGLLQEAGYHFVPTMEEASIVVIYGCTVKNPSEDSYLNSLIRASRLKKMTVGAGCVSQADPNNPKIPNEVSLIGVRELARIVEVVQALQEGKVMRLVPTVAKPLSKAERRKIGHKGYHPDKFDHVKDDPNTIIPSFTVPPINPDPKTLPPLSLPKKRRNPLLEIVCVSVGCDGACAFCKTRFARGKHQSYPPQDLINYVEKVTKEGVKEIWLTGEDVGAYGTDLNRLLGNASDENDKEADSDKDAFLSSSSAPSDSSASSSSSCSSSPSSSSSSQFKEKWTLPRLVSEMCKRVPSDVMIRIGQTNPNHFYRDLDGFVSLMKQPNVYKFAHIPVQCGSDATLRSMRRPYTVEQFRTVVKTLRREDPTITILTDIICGHPEESDEDFEKTLDLVRECEFPFMNITQMYPRKGTPAFDMQRVPTDVVKQRSRKLTLLMKGRDPLAPLKGKKNESALFIDVSEDGMWLIGHLRNYIKVIIAANEEEEEKMLAEALAVEDSKDTTKDKEKGEAKEEDGSEKETKKVLSSFSSLEKSSQRARMLTHEEREEEKQRKLESEPGQSPEEEKKEDEKGEEVEVKKSKKGRIIVGNDDEEGAKGLKDTDATLWKQLIEQKKLGVWIDLDIVATTRYYVIGKRVKKAAE